MSELCNFSFYSLSILDNDKQETSFDVKGYKNIEDHKIIYYFKNENTYKFIIDDNLTVYVNDSIYLFDINKKTEALIRINHLSYKVSVITNKLTISESEIHIEYTLDFITFKGEYKITLKLL